MSKPKVLFVNQEIAPYLDNTPLAEIGRYLPQATQETNKEVRIFMPKFGNVNERKHQLHEVIRLSGINLIIDDTDHPLLIKVASIPQVRMQIYFIDNEDFFMGKNDIYQNDKMIKDNDERSIFYARGVLETTKKLAWKPSVIQCTGWFSMLIPFYLKRTEYKNNPYFNTSKIILTLYNDDFPGMLDENMFKKLKADGGSPKDWKFYKEPTYLNFMKAAISYSDGVVVASKDVRKELIDFATQNKKNVIPYNEDKTLLYKSVTDYYNSIIPKDDED